MNNPDSNYLKNKIKTQEPSFCALNLGNFTNIFDIIFKSVIITLNNNRVNYA